MLKIQLLKQANVERCSQKIYDIAQIIFEYDSNLQKHKAFVFRLYKCPVLLHQINFRLKKYVKADYLS